MSHFCIYIFKTIVIEQMKMIKNKEDLNSIKYVSPSLIILFFKKIINYFIFFNFFCI